MSYKTEQTWFYYLNGRNLELYQRSDYGRTDTLGSGSNAVNVEVLVVGT